MNATKWVNYGRQGNTNEFLLAICDNKWNPLMFYRGYFNYRRGIYKCYPKYMAVAGEYPKAPFELGIYEPIRKY